MTETSFTPREIVSELDRYIVGQMGAKRAVAIALRNRWRRQQLSCVILKKKRETKKKIVILVPQLFKSGSERRREENIRKKNVCDGAS